MSPEANRLSPRNALGVIALFVGVVELAFAYPVAVLSGSMEVVLVVFMVSFPVLVLSAFLFVVIRYPENLYSPSDFQDPQAFAQLVTRRDRLLEKRLEATTDQLGVLISSVQANLRDTAEQMKSISSRIAMLPELDRERLQREADQLLKAVSHANTVLGDYLARQLELYAHHEFLGAHSIWFDTESLGSTWSLDFLVRVALAVLQELRGQGPLAPGVGEVVIEDGDYDRSFEYVVSVYKHNGSVKIKHVGSHCTTG